MVEILLSIILSPAVILIILAYRRRNDYPPISVLPKTRKDYIIKWKRALYYTFIEEFLRYKDYGVMIKFDGKTFWHSGKLNGTIVVGLMEGYEPYPIFMSKTRANMIVSELGQGEVRELDK